MRTFYDILGISRSATQQEILVAYRKRCLETHPDKGGDGRDFMNVRKGYEILSNPEKRKAYDQWVLKKEKDELERKIKEQRVQNEEYLHKNASGNNKTCNNASGNNSTRHYTSDNKVNSEKKDDSSILIIGVVIILLSLTIYFINSNSNIPDKPLQYKNQDVTITSDKIVIKDIKWLYDELSKYSDIGSYSQFKEELKDSIMAGYYYRDASIRGIEIGSFEDFNIMLGKYIFKDIKWLYNELSKYSDIGSYSQFKEELRDSIMAGYYYRDASIRGIEVGNFEDFNKMLMKENIISKPYQKKKL
jgi:DnaJ-class molecular chaperone with C-terminal Zn finger domain